MKGNIKNIRPDGNHFILDFFGCDKKQSDDIKFWKKLLKEGVNEAKLETLGGSFYKFKPKGVTGFLLLEASHISVHTWPEYRYVACDIFSCSSYNKSLNLIKYLKKNIIHEESIIHQIERGYKFFNFDKYIKKGYLEVPNYCDDSIKRIKIKKVIKGIKSDFQEILLVDTYEFGKCLVIDGIVQTSDKDHKIYDKTILNELKKSDGDILVLGGGDGYVAELAIKKNRKLKVNVIDLDAEVVKDCEEFLNQGIFKNPRVKICIEDALKYLKSISEKGKQVDGIVIDLTDNPMRDENLDDIKKFYRNILTLVKKVVKENGWVSMQAGASKVTKKHINMAAVLKEMLLENKFKDIYRKDIMIPSFGEKNAFLFGRK